jgi:hypothetical protein
LTTVYLQHVFTSIGVGPTGHQHVRAESADPNAPTAIDCDVCAPILVRDFGGVYDPDLVPLTDRQTASREKSDREGNAAVRMAAESLARSATAVVTKQAASRRRVADPDDD